jgi:hypothetical protein
LTDYLNHDCPTIEEIIRCYEEIMGEEDKTFFPHQEKRSPKRIIPLQRKIEIIQFAEPPGKKKRKFETVRNRYKSDVKYPIDLVRYKRDVENNGTRSEKLSRVHFKVYDEFKEAKLNNLIVHDENLRRWALQAAREIGLDGFKASPTWIQKFKKMFGIVSRKITKIVTIKSTMCEAEMKIETQKFIETTSQYISVVGAARVVNTDQCGYTREIHTGRTLSFRGDAVVPAQVQSVNHTSHSYTVMPTLSATGELYPKMLLVLQEPTGELGPIVSSKLKIPDNIEVVASKSGKMSAKDVNTYIEKCLIPFCGSKITLILDQWNGFKNRNFIQNALEKFGVEIEVLDLPKGSTSISQPLDVHAFRMFKSWAKKLSDNILLLGIDFQLGGRQNIINMQSLSLEQFSSPRHKQMLLKAWYKPGYIPEKPEKHITPAKFSFGPDGDTCMTAGCNNPKLLRCTWCKSYLCHIHSIVNLHRCRTYVE